MSRYGSLQQQYNLKKQQMSDAYEYLSLHAVGIAKDFGVWLSQTENGEVDPSSQPIPVKAVGCYLTDDEPTFCDDLSAGDAGGSLTFAVELTISTDELPRLSGTVRIPLTLVRYADGVTASEIEGNCMYTYYRNQPTTFLFAELYDRCVKALDA